LVNAKDVNVPSENKTTKKKTEALLEVCYRGWYRSTRRINYVYVFVCVCSANSSAKIHFYVQ